MSRDCNIGPKCLKEPAASLSLLTANFPADGTHPEDQSNEPKDVPQDAECAFEPGVAPWQVTVPGEDKEGERDDTVAYYSRDIEKEEYGGDEEGMQFLLHFPWICGEAPIVLHLTVC